MKVPFLQIRVKRLGLKILALTLSILLWYMVNDMRLETKGIYQVELLFDQSDLPPEMYLELPEDLTVSFSLRGPKEEVRGLISANFTLDVPLENVIVGENKIVLSRDMIRIVNVGEDVRKRVVILSGTIVPEEITANILQIIKPVPVHVRTEGSPAPGYEIVETRVFPEEVSLTGSKDDLEQIRRAETMIIDVTNIDKNFTVDVSIEFSDLLVQPLTDADRQVQVEFVVREK